MGINKVDYYNIIFTNKDVNILSYITVTQPFKINEEIGINTKIPNNYKTKWIDEIKNQFILYKIVNIYHDIISYYNEEHEITHNIYIELKIIKKYPERKDINGN